jgi:hypothetical protein
LRHAPPPILDGLTFAERGYQLLIRPGIPEPEFQRHVVEAAWYRDAVDRLVGGDPAEVYRATLDDLVRKGVCRREGGRLSATARC